MQTPEQPQVCFAENLCVGHGDTRQGQGKVRVFVNAGYHQLHERMRHA